MPTSVSVTTVAAMLMLAALTRPGASDAYVTKASVEMDTNAGVRQQCRSRD